jgi:Putative 2OG-Fe(II) oxygenase
MTKPIIVGDDPQTSAEAVTTNKQEMLASYQYFPSAIYMIDKPEFLTAARALSTQYLKDLKKTQPQPNQIYPLYQTNNMFADKKIEPLASYIAQTSWNILKEQGHNMVGMTTYFLEMWCQEFHKMAGQDEHVHGYGSQLVGFYFLDTPKDCARIVIHDPRPGRKQINLPETNTNNATYASTMINFEPKPGQLFFANSWLSHSFTRHANKMPLRFIHFNLGVMPTPQQKPANDAKIV